MLRNALQRLGAAPGAAQNHRALEGGEDDHGKLARALLAETVALEPLGQEILPLLEHARAHLADHIDRAEEGVPTVITRNGAPVAAVVPIPDFEALEEAAGVMPAREAEAVPAEGGPTVTTAEPLADPFSERGEGAA